MPAEPLSKSKKTYLGIDLGTTNTVAYFNRNGDLEAVDEKRGNSVIPSYVDYLDNKVIVGNNAKNRLNRKKDCVVYNSKRLIGRKFDSPGVQVTLNACGCPVINKDGLPYFQINTTGQELSPVDIGTEIIKFIVGRAKEKTENEIAGLCISVPAHFDDNQRKDTLLCALNCGFAKDDVKIINEPTAAAIQYCHENDIKNGYILVYDFGGGTFDVCILRVKEGYLYVKAYDGDVTLGGLDIDKGIVDLIARKYNEYTGLDLFGGLKTEQRHKVYRSLLKAAEAGKAALSSEVSTTIDIGGLVGGGGGNSTDDDIHFTIAELNQIASPFVDRTIEIIKKVVKESNLSMDDIARVVLVGGSSNLLLVRQKIEQLFPPDKVVCGTNPNECVAQGACRSFFTPIGDEITSHSLGIRVKDNRVQWIIPKNTKLPVEHSVISYIRPDPSFPTKNATTAIYKGDATEGCDDPTPVDKCVLLKEIAFNGYQWSIRELKLKTTFSIQRDNTLSVKIEQTNPGRVLYEERVE